MLDEARGGVAMLDSGREGTASWRGSLETETCQMHLPDEVGEEGRRVEGRRCRVDKARLQR